MSSGPPPDGTLLEAARWLGLLPTYLDYTGVRRQASAASLLAVAGAVVGMPGADEAEVVASVASARAMEQRRAVDPVVVLWHPGPAEVALRLPGGGPGLVEITVDAEDGRGGGERHVLEGVRGAVVDLGPLALPSGRHHLRVLGPGLPEEGCETTVVVAPRRLAAINEVLGGGPSGGVRPWGVFAPVWSAWNPTRPEVHLGSLDAVGAWLTEVGGSLVGTLPLLATFAASPCDPSPYSPVSRRRWNEALVDLQAAPGFADSEEARRLAAAVVPVDPAAPWDPVGHWAAVLPVLDVLAERARRDDQLAVPVLRALSVDPELGRYARFRAEVERRGTGWHAWTEGAGVSLVPGSRTVASPAEVRSDPLVWRWAWSQWVVADQLADLSRRFGARGQALYLDLALGAHAEGFDTWADPALFGWGASVGAPPDAMFGGGQDWGFPPQRPAVARASGHEEWARALRAHLGVCGVLRLDHVLGLQRLYWVPRGASAADGVYVRQPLEELVAVLAVEAERAGAAVVGEDLGTVDPEVRGAMARHGVAGMHIAQFAVSLDPAEGVAWPHAGQLAAVNTHDMPTFVGWMGATDADHRRRAGLIDEAGVVAVHRQRSAEVAALRAALGVTAPGVGDGEGAEDDAGDGGGDLAGAPAPGWQVLLAALVERLGATDADAVLVSLDDLAGVAEQQNVPGTPWSRPNWVVRLPVPLGVLAADAQVEATLAGLDAARRSAVPPAHG